MPIILSQPVTPFAMTCREYIKGCFPHLSFPHIFIFNYKQNRPDEPVQKPADQDQLQPVLIWNDVAGMNKKYKPLRIIPLILFSFTLMKLFLFDISNIPMAGKTAAFFCLGVILLIVS